MKTSQREIFNKELLREFQVFRMLLNDSQFSNPVLPIRVNRWN